MVFLPGDHFLDRNTKVASVARLTMLGESSSGTVTVIHNGLVGFSFTLIQCMYVFRFYITWSHGNSLTSSSALFLQYAKLISYSLS